VPFILYTFLLLLLKPLLCDGIFVAIFCFVSSKMHEFTETCDLLDYYAASSCNFFPDVSEQSIGPIFKGEELEVIMTAMICVVIIRVMTLYSLVGCRHLVYYMTVLWLNNNL